MVPIIGSLVSFVVAALIGGLAIYLAARIVVDVNDYTRAIFTAVLGGIAWALTAWIPLIGPLVALVAWVAVIKWRYPGGWRVAIGIGILAWLSALVILLVLHILTPLRIGAFGVPGV